VSRTDRLALAALMTVLLIAPGCASPKLTGETTSKTLPLKPVSTVSMNEGTLRIRQGSPTSLLVRTDKSLTRYLVVHQDDGTLELGVPDDADLRSYIFAPMPQGGRIEFVLTTDSLDTIHLGGGEVIIDGFEADSLLLDANMGKASISDIDVDEWRCVMVGGPADVTVSGLAGLKSSTNSAGGRYDDSGLVER